MSLLLQNYHKQYFLIPFFTATFLSVHFSLYHKRNPFNFIMFFFSDDSELKLGLLLNPSFIQVMKYHSKLGFCPR